jgi:TIGR03009 family protein
MRWISFSFAILVILPGLALTQPPAQPPNKEQQMLQFVLQSWEQAMGKLEKFSATCTRSAEDKTFGGPPEVYQGSAKFMRTGAKQPSRALLEIASKKDPNKYEKFLYTGVALYEWVPATKVIRIHKVPAPKPGDPPMDENIIAMLTGMTAVQAQQRYKMEWVPDKDNNKWYHYIRIYPTQAKDKADFTEARLTLWSKDFMPRQIWYLEPNGNTKTWDFQITPNDPAVTAQTFAPPQTLPDKNWRADVIEPPGTVAPKKK